MGCEQKCWLQPLCPTFKEGGRASTVSPPGSDQHTASMMEPGWPSPQEREGNTGSLTRRHQDRAGSQPLRASAAQGLGWERGIHFGADADALSDSAMWCSPRRVGWVGAGEGEGGRPVESVEPAKKG